MRKVHHLVQGSPEWHAHRNTPGMINGSEIAAIMGLSSYVTRAEILRRKATGIEPEHDAATLARFAKGHKYEALARPLAEALIDDDLSALVITDTIEGLLFSVSLDGITQGNDITHEHKSLNQALAAALDAYYLPDEYHPQCESGLMVSGATRCLFMASKWDDDDNLIEEKHIWYESNPELRARMIAACKQFEIDRINYVHVEQTVAPVAAPIESLPALSVAVTGSISLVHNLDRFGKRLTEFVGGLNSKPETDQDFADLDAAVKVLKEAEAQLDAAESNALAQTTTIADMQNLVAMYRKVARDNRLMFEKIVKQEKTNRRGSIVSEAQQALMQHRAALMQRIGGNWLPPLNPGVFADAIKGLKSLDSMRDKVSTALANAKIEANAIADTIEANRKSLTTHGAAGRDWIVLFPDFPQVCTKSIEDFHNLVTARVAQDVQRQEAEREKIRQEEAAKLTANNQTQFEDQRGNAQTYTCEQPDTSHLRQNGDGQQSVHADAREMPATEVASTPPIQVHLADAAMITEFLALQSCSPAAKKEMRATIEKWEAYRMKMMAARGLAVAA